MDVRGLLCWVATSPDPVGFLVDPRPYFRENEWRSGTTLWGQPYTYDADVQALHVKLLVDWSSVAGGDAAGGALDTSYGDVPGVIQTTFFGDPCIGAHLERVDLTRFHGPDFGMEARARIDVLPDLGQCEGITRISLDQP